MIRWLPPFFTVPFPFDPIKRKGLGLFDGNVFLDLVECPFLDALDLHDALNLLVRPSPLLTSWYCAASH